MGDRDVPQLAGRETKRVSSVVHRRGAAEQAERAADDLRRGWRERDVRAVVGDQIHELPGAARADDVVEGDVEVAQLVCRHTEERGHRLGAQPQPTTRRAGTQWVE